MAIHIDSCAARETIVVNTVSNVYELIGLRDDEGAVLVRGGRHFPEFRRVLFIGSTVDGGALAPRTIEIGHRMQFICDDRLVTTSAVQSVSRRPARHRLTRVVPEAQVPARQTQTNVRTTTTTDQEGGGDVG